MAVTFARTAFTYGTGTGTASTPTGSGGVLVLMAAGKDITAVTLDTPGDWTSLGSANSGSDYVFAWATDVGTPDMGVTFTGGGEPGLYCWRVDDGSMTGIADAQEFINSFSTTHNPADVASAPDGVAIGLVYGQGTSAGPMSGSLGLTEDYDGDAGGSGWWAGDLVASHGDVTPGGSAWDPGTWTFTNAAIAITSFVVVAAGGGGGPTGSGAPSLTRHAAAGSGSTTAPATSGSGAVTAARHTAAGLGSTGTDGSSSTALVRHVAAGAGFVQNSGTGAVTTLRVTAAGSGTTAAPPGVGTVTTARLTAVGSGSTVQPGTSGSGTLQPTRHSAAATGSTGASGVSATTTAGYTASGSGSCTAPATGTGAVTTAPLTGAGSGVTGQSGTGAVTGARLVAAGAGQTGTLGSSTLSTARCTASGSGSAVAPNTSGSGAPGTGPHTAAGSGSTGTSGSGALTTARHTIVGLPPVVGTGALTLARVRVRTSGPAKGGLATPRPILTRLSAAQKREALRTFDTTRWTDASLSGSWVNVVNQPNVQYSRAQGRVYIRGQASGGTGQVFILPKKFRPPQTIQKFVGTSQYQITNAGVVSRISGTGTAYMDMDFSVRG